MMIMNNSMIIWSCTHQIHPPLGGSSLISTPTTIMKVCSSPEAILSGDLWPMFLAGWWLGHPPLRKILVKSIGMRTDTQYEWENKKWQPNHQPARCFVPPRLWFLSFTKRESGWQPAQLDSNARLPQLRQEPRHGKNIWGVSWNGGAPKSSIFMGFSTINQPLWDSPILGSPHMEPTQKAGSEKVIFCVGHSIIFIPSPNRIPPQPGPRTLENWVIINRSRGLSFLSLSTWQSWDMFKQAKLSSLACTTSHPSGYPGLPFFSCIWLSLDAWNSTVRNIS